MGLVLRTKSIPLWPGAALLGLLFEVILSLRLVKWIWVKFGGGG